MNYLSPSDWTDQELCTRLLVSEGVAWREFHQRFDRLIYRCIHNVTARFAHSTSRVEPEEVYGDFLLELTRRDMAKLRAWDPQKGCKLSSWIAMIAKNVAWDRLRRASRQVATCELDHALATEDAADTPFEDTLWKERKSMLDSAIESLSERDRLFVQLYFRDGLDSDEIAANMNISLKTVYSKRHKIENRLRATLCA